MDEQRNNNENGTSQIYHELGKLSSNTDTIIREMATLRGEIRERVEKATEDLRGRIAAVAKSQAEHASEDDRRFLPLERMHWKTAGIVVATCVFWTVVASVAAIYLR